VPFTWTFRLFVPWLFTTGLVLAVYVVWDRRAHAREAKTDLKRDFYEVRACGSPGRRTSSSSPGSSRPSRSSTPRGGRARSSPSPSSPGSAPTRGCTGRTASPSTDPRGGGALRRDLRDDAARPPHPAGARGRARRARALAVLLGDRALSSFLDNAPTYLTFLALARSLQLPADVVGVPNALLTAVSLGAVFMGANTYIGNGPNFMVRSIAEERGVKMPSFGGYMLYSGAVLIPVFVVVTVVFF